MEFTMTAELEELKSPWVELYEQCLESAYDYPYSDLEGFPGLYARRLKTAILLKQNRNKKISITEASTIADRAAKHTLVELRAKFTDRCSFSHIKNELRKGSASQIPGRKIIDNGMAAKFMNIVVGFPTYKLSSNEIKFLLSKFDSDLVHYDSEKWHITIKVFELHLEEAEPTPQEMAVLDSVARSSIPSIIAYTLDSDYKIDWKDFFNAVKARVKETVKQGFNRFKSRKGDLDNEQIEALFDE